MERSCGKDKLVEHLGTLIVEAESIDELSRAFWAHIVQKFLGGGAATGGCRLCVGIATKHDTGFRWIGKRERTLLLYIGLLREGVRSRMVSDAVLDNGA